MHLREELEAFLNQDTLKFIKEGRKPDIWIWGTGNTAELYQEGFLRLEREGFQIKGYCDNFQKDSVFFHGKPVISPCELQEQENSIVLICSPQPGVIHAVGEQLDEMQMEWYPIDEVILKEHQREILQCFDLMEDELSKKTYAEIVKCRIQGENPGSRLCSGEPYFAFAPFKKLKPGEIFIDCGAYVGDTIEKYIETKLGTFGKIIAFEPDSGKFAAMQKRVKRLEDEWDVKDSITLYPYGVGDKSADIGFQEYKDNNKLGAKLSEAAEGTSVCRMVAMDDFVQEYSFLKADIESYEYKMLLGAEHGIQANKPLLALSIYHNAVDLYEIPLLIRKMVPEYHFGCRHHTVELYDTILYAWAGNECI